MRNYITKPYILLPLVVSLLVQFQPLTAAEWENLVVAQNGTNNECPNMGNPPKCDGKRVPPVSQPSTAAILQLITSW